MTGPTTFRNAKKQFEIWYVFMMMTPTHMHLPAQGSMRHPPVRLPSQRGICQRGDNGQMPSSDLQQRTLIYILRKPSHKRAEGMLQEGRGSGIHEAKHPHEVCNQPVQTGASGSVKVQCPPRHAHGPAGQGCFHAVCWADSAAQRRAGCTRRRRSLRARSVPTLGDVFSPI